MTTQADALNRIAKALEEQAKEMKRRNDLYEQHPFANNIRIVENKETQAETQRTPIQNIGWTPGTGNRGLYESQLAEDNLDLAGEIQAAGGRFDKGEHYYWLGNRDPLRIFRRKRR